jgi:hypothetical protein
MWRVGRSTGGFVLLKFIIIFQLLQRRAFEQLIKLQQLFFQFLQWNSRNDRAGTGSGLCPLQRIECAA